MKKYLIPLLFICGIAGATIDWGNLLVKGTLTVSGSSSLAGLTAGTTNLGTTSTGAFTASATTNLGTVSAGTWNGTAIAATKGGTGLTSGTSGGVPYFSSSTTIASSGALTANALVLGGGAGAAPTSLGAGTSTTVLHGNAGGAPTFAAVDLTADVTGVLPQANGGTGGYATNSILVSGCTSVSNEFGGDWVNTLTNNSTGDCTLNLQTWFTTAPNCTCTVVNDSNPNSRFCKIRSSSTSAVRIFVATNSDVAAAENSMVVCHGPK